MKASFEKLSPKALLNDAGPLPGQNGGFSRAFARFPAEASNPEGFHGRVWHGQETGHSRLLSLIFLADSIRSLVRAPNKLAYLKWGWLDFAGSIPAVLPLRLVRLARLLRAWRVVRTQHPRQVLREFEEHRAHGALLVTINSLPASVCCLTVESLLCDEICDIVDL